MCRMFGRAQRDGRTVFDCLLQCVGCPRHLPLVVVGLCRVSILRLCRRFAVHLRDGVPVVMSRREERLVTGPSAVPCVSFCTAFAVDLGVTMRCLQRW